MRRFSVIAMLLIAACSSEQPPEPQTEDSVVVYVAYEDSAAIRAQFDRYTAQTGVAVIDRRGATQAMVEDLVENRITPPADLFVTRSVLPAWRAAEESALRPVFEESLSAGLPEWAMDPDKLWFAIAADRAVIAYGGDAPLVADVDDLAEENFMGELCLSSSQHALNRAVIAGLLDRMAVREAELIVRGWVANLARHPLADPAELTAAIKAGDCAAGIVAASEAERAGLSFVEPATPYVDVEAVGVARHAHNPDGAARLAEWLVANFDWPAGAPTPGASVAAVARFHEDAVKLAERARYF